MFEPNLVDEQRDVFATSTNGRHAECHGAEPVVEAPVEAPALDSFFQVVTRRREDPGVDARRCRRSEGPHLANLDETKHVPLSLDRQLRGLVKEDGTAIGPRQRPGCTRRRQPARRPRTLPDR